MKTIHKYEVFPNEKTLMPLAAKILYMGSQEGNFFVWALIDSKVEDQELRDVRVFGTGFIIPDEALEYLDHINSWQDGPFVWHGFADISIFYVDSPSHAKEVKDSHGTS